MKELLSLELYSSPGAILQTNAVISHQCEKEEAGEMLLFNSCCNEQLCGSCSLSLKFEFVGVKIFRALFQTKGLRE